MMLKGLMDEGCQDRTSLRIGSLVEGRATGRPQSKNTNVPLICSAI